MTNYYLTWDGISGHIICNDIRLTTDVKFSLPFEYEALYYEPEIGNKFYFHNNERVQITDEQEAQIRTFCETYVEETDYMVHTYDTEGKLYRGDMLKSEAIEQGLGYVVSDLPIFPAAKWMDGHWDRVRFVVRDDGSTQMYPDFICDHCVYGYAEEESDQIPDQPNMYYTWDIATSSWKDVRTLKQAKVDAASSLRADFELLRYALSSDVYYIPSFERETWNWQVHEATDWLANNEVETPYIDAFLNARTDENKPTKQVLCEDIIANHKAFLQAMATVNAKQWYYLSQVKAATTNDECYTLQMAARTYCEAERAKIPEAL